MILAFFINFFRFNNYKYIKKQSNNIYNIKIINFINPIFNLFYIYINKY